MKQYHLTHSGLSWILSLANVEETLLHFFDKDKVESIELSKEYILEHGGGSLVIHKLDGTFEEERTYPRTIDPPQSPG